MRNVLLNLGLFAIKFIGGQLSHSVSVISDAFNNLADAATTMLAWLGLKVSSLGAGETHPNGHGRFEWVIALLSAVSIMLIGWELLRDSIAAIRDPQQLVFGAFTVAALVLSIAVKTYMFWDNRQKSKQNDSAALKAVSLDCLSDAVSTTVVLLSLVIHEVFHLNVDGWCGILVALFILYNGVRSFLETGERVMGRSATKEQLAQLRAFALQNADFQAIDDLQIEDYGYGRFRVSMTAVGKPEASAERLLNGAAALKYRIREKYGYHAQIVVERSLAGDPALQACIDEALAAAGAPLTLLSLRLTDAGDFKLAELALSIDMIDIRKKDAAEAALTQRFAHAPEGWRIVYDMRLGAPSGRQTRKQWRRERRAQAKAKKA